MLYLKSIIAWGVDPERLASHDSVQQYSMRPRLHTNTNQINMLPGGLDIIHSVKHASSYVC